MNEQIPNKRLCCALCTLFFLGNCTLFLPFKQGAKASFFGLCLAFVLGTLLIPPAFKLFSKNRFTNDKFGIVLGVIFCIFALITAIITAADFSLVSNEKILTRENNLLFSLVFSLLNYFILKSDKKVLFKTSFIFLVLIIFSQIILFLMSSNQFDFSNIKTLGLKGTFWQFLYFFSKSIAPLIILPVLVGKEKNSKQGAYCGIILAFFLILLPLAQILLIFGPSYAETLHFPFIMVLDTVSIGLKYSRLEGLSFIIFFFGALIKCSVCLFCAKEIIQKLFKKSKRFLPLGLSLFLFFTTLISKRIAALDTILSFTVSLGAIALMVVALLKSRTHCQCKTK